MASTGQSVLSDSFGNNTAIACPGCGYPMLLTVLDNQRGSDRDHAVACRKCGRETWVERLVPQSGNPSASDIEIH